MKGLALPTDIFPRLWHNVSKVYLKNGESENSVRQIQRMVNAFVCTETSSQIFTNLLSDGKHHTQRIVDKNLLKITLHTTPAHHVIPAHAHPETLNIIYVLQGELRVEQLSLFDPAEQHIHTLTRHQSCVGLRRYKNIHRIQTLTEPAVFMSIHLKKLTRAESSNTKVLPWFFSCLLLLSSCDGSSMSTEKASKEKMANPVGLFSRPQSYTVDRDIDGAVANPLAVANKLRNSEDNDDTYVAAQLYLQAAKNGNAEAQYWLGVMYMDGLGITDNMDEALYWVAAASNQEYPPAEKLLHIILETEEIMDC